MSADLSLDNVLNNILNEFENQLTTYHHQLNETDVFDLVLGQNEDNLARLSRDVDAVDAEKSRLASDVQMVEKLHESLIRSLRELEVKLGLDDSDAAKEFSSLDERRFRMLQLLNGANNEADKLELEVSNATDQLKTLRQSHSLMHADPDDISDGSGALSAVEQIRGMLRRQMESLVSTESEIDVLSERLEKMVTRIRRK